MNHITILKSVCLPLATHFTIFPGPRQAPTSPRNGSPTPEGNPPDGESKPRAPFRRGRREKPRPRAPLFPRLTRCKRILPPVETAGGRSTEGREGRGEDFPRGKESTAETRKPHFIYYIYKNGAPGFPHSVPSSAHVSPVPDLPRSETAPASPRRVKDAR